jgi:hypothetical protein
MGSISRAMTLRTSVLILGRANEAGDTIASAATTIAIAAVRITPRRRQFITPIVPDRISPRLAELVNAK